MRQRVWENVNGGEGEGTIRISHFPPIMIAHTIAGFHLPMRGRGTNEFVMATAHPPETRKYPDMI